MFRVDVVGLFFIGSKNSTEGDLKLPAREKKRWLPIRPHGKIGTKNE